MGLFAKRIKEQVTALPAFLFGIIYLSTIFFVVHRDIARYALPIAPLALLGYAPFFTNKYVKIAALILVIPIFLYSWNFILNNVQPIMDWSYFL